MLLLPPAEQEHVADFPLLVLKGIDLSTGGVCYWLLFSRGRTCTYCGWTKSISHNRSEPWFLMIPLYIPTNVLVSTMFFFQVVREADFVHPL